MIPFAIMLLSIAVMPLAAEKWWNSNLHKLYVSLFLATAVGICQSLFHIRYEFRQFILPGYVCVNSRLPQDI